MGIIMEEVEYCEAGSPDYVKGKWKEAIQQYLSYISEESGISIADLLGKLNIKLGNEDGVIGIVVSITSEEVYEMFIYKSGDNVDDPIDATLADIVIVKALVEHSKD
jgi:hypothetical protein